jgi:hypothetical protein
MFVRVEDIRAAILKIAEMHLLVEVEPTAIELDRFIWAMLVGYAGNNSKQGNDKMSRFSFSAQFNPDFPRLEEKDMVARFNATAEKFKLIRKSIAKDKSHLIVDDVLREVCVSSSLWVYSIEPWRRWTNTGQPFWLRQSQDNNSLTDCPSGASYQKLHNAVMIEINIREFNCT